jgi:hypothetical protein
MLEIDNIRRSIGNKKMINFDENTFVPDKNTDWYYIAVYQKLSEQFIEKHSDKINWSHISACQKLSEKFIEKHSDKINWYDISRYQKLSEQFIEKHSDKINWTRISVYQKLSEEFIEKHSDKVCWYYISQYQKLSEQFIEKHSNKVDWINISRYQKLSEKFRKKHDLTISENCWLYKTKKEKLQYIKKNTNYGIIDNQYIIAYKSTRIDGSSVFNRQYHYEIGNTYESHCDCNINNENSFGLSAWTKEQALEYYNIGKLFKVKINIEDIGCFVQNNNKIRCWKLTILEEV